MGERIHWGVFYRGRHTTNKRLASHMLFSLSHTFSLPLCFPLSLTPTCTYSLSLILAFSLSLSLSNSQPLSFSAFSAAVPLSLTQTHTHSMFCFVSWRPFGFFLGLYRLNRIDVKLVVILLTLGAQFWTTIFNLFYLLFLTLSLKIIQFISLSRIFKFLSSQESPLSCTFSI